MTMEPEQTEAAPEQDAPEPEEQAPNEEPETPEDGAPGTETPEAEAEAPYTPDLTTDAGIAEAERRFPTFKAQQEKHRADARNAERQRLVRESGEDRRVQGLVSQLRDRLLDADDQDAPKTVAEALKLNGDYHTDRVSRAVALAAAKAHGWDEDTLKVTLENIERLSGGDLDSFAETVVSASVTAQAKKIAAAEIEKAEKRIQKEADARIAAAVKAAKVEVRQVKDNPPTTSASGASAGRPTTSQWADASFEQRQEWKRNGVEPVLA